LDRQHLLKAVQDELAALEAHCGQLERALMNRQWDLLETAIADSRRITHALQNAMDAAKDARTKEFDDAVTARLRYVFAIRENQMARLRHYHDAVGERLQLLTRWKHALKSIGSRRPLSRLSSLDQLS
jgi:hypothetical protein